MTSATAVAQAQTNRATLLPSVATLTKRALRIYLRTPQVVVMRIIQAVVFLLIFRYVFGGALNTGSLEYIDFMAPGILVVSVMFATIGTALGVAEDMNIGLYDRLRSLPMPRSAVLTGRVLADTVITVIVLIPMIAITFLVGMRVHTGFGSAIAAFALCALFGFAFVWIFTFVGLAAGSTQAAQGISFLVMPLSFASSAFVPTTSMPGWLQTFTENQPVTIVVDAVRTLIQGPQAEQLLGNDTQYYVTRALLWMLGLIVVFAALAIARYRKH